MNDIKIKEGDYDGFILTDQEEDRIYIYYSEAPELCDRIKKFCQKQR